MAARPCVQVTVQVSPPAQPSQPSKSQHSQPCPFPAIPAQRITAQPSPAQPSAAKHSAALPSPAQSSTAQPSPAQQSTAQPSPAQPRRAQHSPSPARLSQAWKRFMQAQPGTTRKSQGRTRMIRTKCEIQSWTNHVSQLGSRLIIFPRKQGQIRAGEASQARPGQAQLGPAKPSQAQQGQTRPSQA